MDPKLYMRLMQSQNRSSGEQYNPDAGKRWIANWMLHRRQQLIDNAGGVRQSNEAASLQNKNLFSVPTYPSVEAMNKGQESVISNLNRSALTANGSSAGVLNFWAKQNRKVLDAANEVMSMPTAAGTYISDGIGHRVLVATPGENDSHQSVLVHELTHSMEAKPQERKIAEIMKNSTVKGGSNYYFEDPTEIYSRLMQIRHDMELDPGKKYTRDDLNELRKKSNKYNILDRYDDETILRLLNEVASVNKPDSGKRNA